MPFFEGDDPDGWIFKAERYFTVIGMTDEEKTDATTLCLEGVVVPMGGKAANGEGLGGLQVSVEKSLPTHPRRLC